jgi:hypothetical protein
MHSHRIESEGFAPPKHASINARASEVPLLVSSTPSTMYLKGQGLRRLKRMERKVRSTPPKVGQKKGRK